MLTILLHFSSELWCGHTGDDITIYKFKDSRKSTYSHHINYGVTTKLSDVNVVNIHTSEQIYGKLWTRLQPGKLKQCMLRNWTLVKYIIINTILLKLSSYDHAYSFICITIKGR